jgi:hypothetical protein
MGNRDPCRVRLPYSDLPVSVSHPPPVSSPTRGEEPVLPATVYPYENRYRHLRCAYTGHSANHVGESDVDVPDTIINVFESTIVASAGGQDVDQAPIPPGAATGANRPDLNAEPVPAAVETAGAPCQPPFNSSATTRLTRSGRR